LYDGYVVNAIIDGAYASAASKRWEPVNLPLWRGAEGVESTSALRDYDADHVLIKQERMMDGTVKVILRNKQSGKVVQRIQPA
jgi:hypothetical protein